MEQIANQTSTIVTVFSDYVLNPAKIRATDADQLASLLKEFPYCQVLHAFVSRAILMGEGEDFGQSLTKAALYSSNRNILYTVVNHPDTLFRPREEDYTLSSRKPDYKLLAIHPEPTLMAQSEEEVAPSLSDLQEASRNEAVERLPVKEELAKETFVGEQLVALEESKTAHEVSKYDDDTMPYSFLWWLNKTRKEYAGGYPDQPYLKAQIAKNNTIDGLNHQIVEHVFHQQSPPLKDLESQIMGESKLTFKRKEESILDKFIQDDPQIKPPHPGSLSTENKARQSAQDLNDLVSETLAGIYTRQMLLDKAIDTYKKLSLRFPEKSAYFTELIHTLEEKLNK